MNLKEIADEIEDINDPTSIEKVFFYIYQVNEEDDDFMELLFDTCKDEEIYWEQPWYQHSTCLTRRLIDTGEDESNQYRTDPISKEEDEKITKNWRKFIKKYQLPDKLVSFARWRNKNGSRNPNALQEKVRRFVAAYLARGLERSVYQVFKYVMTHTGKKLKSQYTPEEEKIMKVCFYHKPDKAVTYLSTLLGREPRGIYKKLSHINNGAPPRKRVKWTLDIAAQFLHSLIKHAEMSLDDLKYKKFDTSVWLKVQEDMDHSYEYLQKFWYKSLHVQLFVKRDVKLNRLRKKIYKLLRLYSYKVWTDIRWKDLLNHFPDGFTHMFLYKVCSVIVRQYPNYLTCPLEDIIEYGLGRAKKTGFKERRLKTLKLNENGQLEIIQYVKENA